MGFFKRLIGKFAGSDIGKKIIGKTARAAHTLIGKVEHTYGNIKRGLPQFVQDGLNKYENDSNFARDTKASYAAAKQDIADHLDHDKGIA